MLLATQHRTAIIVGYAITAIVRVLLTWTVVTFVAVVIAGMEVGGSAVDVVVLYLLSLTVNVVALLFSCGIALRLRTLQAGPLMQFPVFILLFLTPVYVPQALLAGWISHVAKVQSADPRPQHQPRPPRRPLGRDPRRLRGRLRPRRAARRLGRQRDAPGGDRGLAQTDGRS